MGHAVLELNSLDGGHRRFLLVQLPEPTGNNSEPSQTLFDLCRKRMKCVIDEIRGGDSEGGQSTGFRVFKLATTNFHAWEPNREKLTQTLEQATEHLRSDRTEDDILHELLLKLGLDLASCRLRHGTSWVSRSKP